MANQETFGDRAALGPARADFCRERDQPEFRQVACAPLGEYGAKDLSAYMFDGHLDLHAYAPAVGGWLCSGWVTRPWTDPDTAVTAIVRHGDFEHRGELTAAFHDRPDVHGRGVGCVLFMPETSLGKELEQPLSSIEIDTGTSRLRLRGNGQRAVALRQLMATPDLRLIEDSEGAERAALKSTLLRCKGPSAEPPDRRRAYRFLRLLRRHRGMVVQRLGFIRLGG
jgi:hypothetical protein